MKFKLVQAVREIKTGNILPNGSYEFKTIPVGKIIDAMRSWQHGGRVYPVRGGYIEIQSRDLIAFNAHFHDHAIEVPDKEFAAAVAEWAKDPKNAQAEKALQAMSKAAPKTGNPKPGADEGDGGDADK